MARENKYWPDVAIPPGETLLEILEENGMTQADLAERTGRPKKTINEIIKGKVAITPETAIQLEMVLKVPARFWNNLEMNYRETLARIDAKAAFEEQLEWLKAVPVKVMQTYDWIKKISDPAKQMEEVLMFFGVASVRGWEKIWDRKLCNSFSFRKSDKYTMDKVALSVWLRAGQLEAAKLQCQPYDAKKFKSILSEIRKLTDTGPDIFVPKVQELCATAGVAVVFVRELSKVPVNGVTHWLSSNKAVIQLSLRYKTDDHLWFSFFHEAGHILIHGKRDFIDEGLTEEPSEQERQVWEDEANEFATQTLIIKSAYDYFVQCRSFTDASISNFAKSQGISPGIVVGRLQHDEHILFNRSNHLKRKFIWA